MTTTHRPSPPSSAPDPLRERAARLQLYGLLAHWEEYGQASWLSTVVEHEEAERQRRSLERRIRNARIGRFKPIADFDSPAPRNSSGRAAGAAPRAGGTPSDISSRDSSAAWLAGRR